MKKILLLALCCLTLCGCEKTLDEPQEDYSNKMLVCTISEEGSYDKTDHIFKFHFEKDGVLKQLYHSYTAYFNTTEKALSYYSDNYDGVMKINGNIVTSSDYMDITNLLKSEKRGTFEKEKSYWENQGFDCKVQDAE